MIIVQDIGNVIVRVVGQLNAENIRCIRDTRGSAGAIERATIGCILGALRDGQRGTGISLYPERLAGCDDTVGEKFVISCQLAACNTRVIHLPFKLCPKIMPDINGRADVGHRPPSAGRPGPLNRTRIRISHQVPAVIRGYRSRCERERNGALVRGTGRHPGGGKSGFPNIDDISPSATKCILIGAPRGREVYVVGFGIGKHRRRRTQIGARKVSSDRNVLLECGNGKPLDG